MRIIKGFIAVTLIAHPLQSKPLIADNQSITLQKVALGAGALSYLGYLGYKYYSCTKEVAKNNKLIKSKKDQGAVPVPPRINKLIKQNPDFNEFQKNPPVGYKISFEIGKIEVTKDDKFRAGSIVETQSSYFHPFTVKNRYHLLRQKNIASSLPKSPSVDDGNSSDSSMSTYGEPEASFYSSTLKINRWKTAILLQASVGVGLLCQQFVRLMDK